MNTKKGLKYSKTHEWLDIKDNVAKIGITDFAQDSLGDIVFVELPESGKNLNKDQDFGVVESVKAVSDLVSPISGSVVEINSELLDAPGSLNSDPYGSWIIALEITSPKELDELLNEEGYIEFCRSEE